MLPSAATDSRLSPGATTSGFAKPSYHDGPRELYGATRSSSRVTVSKVFDRADGERRRRVAGRNDAGVPGLACLRIRAEVAGRHDDRRARRATACSTACTSGSVAARFVNRMAERKVEHVDAEQMPVRDRELDRADDVVGRALALAVEHLERR